jgi:hypothetical protein
MNKLAGSPVTVRGIIESDVIRVDSLSIMITIQHKVHPIFFQISEPQQEGLL